MWAVYLAQWFHLHERRSRCIIIRAISKEESAQTTGAFVPLDVCQQRGVLDVIVASAWIAAPIRDVS